MSIWQRWFNQAQSTLTPHELERLRLLPAAVGLGDQRLTLQRFVVMDQETTGLNTQRDKVLSIGAVVVEHGHIDMSQQFEVNLKREHNVLNPSVLIHGIAPSAAARGTPPPQALLSFMEWSGECVFLAFHAPFDQRMLARALRNQLQITLRHVFLDLAELAPMLFPDADIGRGGLDDWVEHFGLQVLARHSAAADAQVSAELALIVLKKAQQQGITTLAELNQRLHAWRRLQRSKAHA
ncbi:3'-5' exonuclease [Atopomonas sediminilitoris]|uniref:3'-5' exonuclease n=1 Tax=Atopomonas sediminilitoris TaxID=2919919 RepID=UPI001F4E5187|nr:3'-5' exonuclease [Atopomonas sediminilitoris]MCJ8170856.1 3'-5' exonuclease [Atopomonas sediminilitoris]